MAIRHCGEIRAASFIPVKATRYRVAHGQMRIAAVTEDSPGSMCRRTCADLAVFLLAREADRTMTAGRAGVFSVGVSRLRD